MSWLSEILDSFVDGIEGKPAVSIDTSKPVGAALAPIVSAAQGLGSTLKSTAQTSVDAYLEAQVGPAGTQVADMALNALITYATSKLSLAGKAAASTTS